MALVRGLALLLLAFRAGTALACYAPPRGQLIDVDAQLRAATDVAVGQVISATPLDGDNVEYRFIVLDRLAGPVREVFTVTGWGGDKAGNDTTFDDHRDFAFWARGGGRTMNSPDCVIHPNFVVGGTYLVFLGAPSTRRSFEKIGTVDGAVDRDDKWLAYVASGLRKRPVFDGVTPAGTAAGAGSGGDTAPDYDRVGRFIYAFQRAVPRDDIERRTLAGRHAPTPLLLRAGRLADEYDHILHAIAAVPDAEIEATLREAAAVGAALKAWRDGGAG